MKIERKSITTITMTYLEAMILLRELEGCSIDACPDLKIFKETLLEFKENQK